MSTFELRSTSADIFVPDGNDAGSAIRRTTHLAIGAHQDDIPIMALDGVLQCFSRNDRWFLGVTVTDGAGSPRTGSFAQHSDEEMVTTRVAEERRAATVGRYSGAIQLGYPSAVTRDNTDADVVADLATILTAATPATVYTHSPADKHDTHVATALRTISAIRSLPAAHRPVRLYGCEVWRGHDWLDDQDKVVFEYSGAEELFSDLMSAYKSQTAGGKRYDLATIGRWRANATFLASHRVDQAGAIGIAMDLTPLIADPDLDITSFVAGFADRLSDELSSRISRLN